MDLPLYQIDAFAHGPFTGNPAAVCPLDGVTGGDWLPDALMQAIALENNLAETAFFRTRPDGSGSYDLRWFTPAVEVDLCGHATLATGHVVLEILEPHRDRVTFYSRSGPLGVFRTDGMLALDFPVNPMEPSDDADLRARVGDALGTMPEGILRSQWLMAVFPDAAAVRDLAPDLRKVAALDRDGLGLGLIATAPGDGQPFDCVSRYFAPARGIDEDPVTGSAHTRIVPYWAARLGKQRIVAHQASPRGGVLTCELTGDRMTLAGESTAFLQGTIHLPDDIGQRLEAAA